MATSIRKRYRHYIDIDDPTVVNFETVRRNSTEILAVKIAMKGYGLAFYEKLCWCDTYDNSFCLRNITTI